ncbi:MAG: hypothetical protein IPG90_21705 [Bacteroidetes bacterium]|nr:hypothetical protein [Bacteroidota bacterium]
MSHLLKLIGKPILDVQTNISQSVALNDSAFQESKIELFLQLVFDGYHLNIYNKFELIGLTSLQYLLLKGKTINNIIESKENVVFYLNEGIRFILDLRDDAFIGPEAMCLYGPDNLIVVWN